jgi:hypothetical protein
MTPTRGRDLGRHHSVSLSDMIWAELKVYAAKQRSTASELIAFALKHYLDERPPLKAGRYQSRQAGEGPKACRSIYIPDELWNATQAAAKENGFSLTVLIDLLLKAELGLTPAGGEFPSTITYEMPDEHKTAEPPTSHRYLRVGEKLIDLGENPLTIELATGQIRRGNKPEKSS